jgi:hypothetical protein
VRRVCFVLVCVTTGFLYIRYGVKPDAMWRWMEPYLDDVEPITPWHDPNQKTTIGARVVPFISLSLPFQNCSSLSPVSKLFISLPRDDESNRRYFSP